MPIGGISDSRSGGSANVTGVPKQPPAKVTPEFLAAKPPSGESTEGGESSEVNADGDEKKSPKKMDIPA